VAGERTREAQRLPAVPEREQVGPDLFAQRLAGQRLSCGEEQSEDQAAAHGAS